MNPAITTMATTKCSTISATLLARSDKYDGPSPDTASAVEPPKAHQNWAPAVALEEPYHQPAGQGGQQCRDGDLCMLVIVELGSTTARELRSRVGARNAGPSREVDPDGRTPSPPPPPTLGQRPAVLVVDRRQTVTA
jgi:hypothetical protein